MSVLVIAEAACTFRFGDDHLANAYRSIRAAKDAGADCWKTQWTSDGRAMAVRRSGRKHDFDQGECGEDQCPTCNQGEMYQRYLQYDPAWLKLLKAECDRVGIEFMCTVYLPQDVAVIAPFVKRFKVAAMECNDEELINKCLSYGKQIILSLNDKHNGTWSMNCNFREPITTLHCISKYPCPIEEIGLRDGIACWDGYGGKNDGLCDGLSDHTGHVLTGAVAVGAGATVIESHVKLWDTPEENPDYGHSLEFPHDAHNFGGFYDEYVQNIRTAEQML